MLDEILLQGTGLWKIIDDMFYAEQGKDLLVQLTDTSK